MPITKTFNNTSYSIPLEGELNWSTLSSFLVALADNTQTTNKQKIGTRVATATPVTVLATTDCLIITDLAVAGAVAVNLPAGVTSQVFTVVDGKGDAGTNNITITPAAGTINGAATYVIDSNRAGVTLVYNGTEWTVIAEFISSGDIPRNQIAAGTANHVVINNGSGDLSSEAALAASRGGLATDASAFTGYVKGAAGVFSASAIAAGDLPTGIDATKIADGSVDNTEFQYINSLTSNAQTQINAKVTGAASSTDNAIARFDSTTGKIVQNSGVTVDDSNNVAGVVDITPTTLNSVAIANYLTTTNTKAVTNKDIDGGTASDTSRITIPKASKSTLDGLTRKEGTLVYASDLDKLYADDGSSLKEIGSGGSGINYLADYFTSDTLGTVGNANVTDTGNRSTGTFSAWQSTNTTDISLSVSSSSPLRSPNCYLFSGSGNNASGTKFVESPAFQLHVADLGKPVMVSFDLADVTADGNFDVIMVRYNSSGTYQEKISIAGNASGATPASAKLPTGISKFNGFFIANSTATDYYALRFRRLAGTDTPRLDSNKISPEQVVQGAAITDWQSATLTTSVGFGTVTNHVSFMRQVGDSAEIYGHFQSGTRAATYAAVILPNSLITANKFNTTPISVVGSWWAASTGSPFYSTSTAGAFGAMLGNISDTAVYMSSESNATNGLVASAATNIGLDNAYVNYHFTVPISGWSSNVTMANRAVEEYASNYGTTATTDDATSFAYGASGSNFANITAAHSKTVRFTTPILSTDKISLEITTDGGTTWVDVGQSAANIYPFVEQSGNTYGMSWWKKNATDVYVFFGTYCKTIGATFGSAGTAWSTIGADSTYKWRVRKTSGGASVGFPVSARNIVGDTSGTAVPSGYIGEVIEGTTASGISITSAPTYLGNSSTTGVILLTPGTYLLSAYGRILASDLLVYLPTAFGVISGAATFIDMNNATPSRYTDDILDTYLDIDRKAIARVTSTSLIGVKVTAISGGTGSNGVLSGINAIRIA